MIHATLLLVALAGLPIPDAQAQSSAEALIQEVYGEQLESARGPEEKAKLGREILQVANEEPDPANKYVGIVLARRLATEALDGGLALEAVQAQVAAFEGELDGDTERSLRRAEMLWDVAESKRGEEQLQRRLEAVEYWLRAESESKLLQKNWQERIAEIKSGGTVVLSAKDADLVGTQLAHSERVDAAWMWIDPRQYPEWKVPLDHGRYAVSIEYAADAHMAPRSIFLLQVLVEGAAKPAFSWTFTLKETGDWPTFASIPIGVVTIRREHQYVIRLRVVRKVARSPQMGIIYLRAMQFAPASDSR